MNITPETTTYRDFHITDYTAVRRMTCPVQISVPGFGSLGARDLEEAHTKIDNIIASREAAPKPGEARITFLSGPGRSIKASTCRKHAENARTRTRRQGRFA